jgi:hypothetical protein
VKNAESGNTVIRMMCLHFAGRRKPTPSISGR